MCFSAKMSSDSEDEDFLFKSKQQSFGNSKTDRLLGIITCLVERCNLLILMTSSRRLKSASIDDSIEVEQMLAKEGKELKEAQIRPEKNQQQRELTAELETIYRSLSQSTPDNEEVKVIYDGFLGGKESERERKSAGTSNGESGNRNKEKFNKNN
jgi:hypothetical protein